MEMWCPDDIGRDSWDWVGPPAWERACFNSPEWGGGSSPVKTEPLQIVLWLLLLLWWLLLCGCCVLLLSWRSIHKCVYPHSEIQKARAWISERALHMQPGGVGLCNLISANSPRAHLSETTQPWNAQPSLPAHEEQRPTKRQLSIVWEVAAPKDPKTFTDICLFGKSYPLPFNFSKSSKAGNIHRTLQTDNQRMNRSRSNQGRNTTRVRQPKQASYEKISRAVPHPKRTINQRLTRPRRITKERK